MFLRPLSIDCDVQALHSIYGDPQSCAYLPDPSVKEVADTRALLENYDQGHLAYSWVIVESMDADAIGRVKMIPCDSHVYEAVIMVRPDARGKGAAFAGLGMALDIVFDKHNARRVFADIDPDNVASIKLFERLGFQQEGLLRATYETHLGVRDTVLMGLIDADPKPWRGR